MNKLDAKERKTYIDTARALCMLWIVGYWHMDIDHSRFMPWIEGFTIGVLATFTFLSGYLGGGHIKTNKEVLVFYLKRIKRFYLLFVLSCITLYILHLIFHVNYISSTSQFIYSLLGMSCFIGVAPQTIWYMVMIMFFYLVTPLITRWKKIGIKMISACAIFVFLYLLYKLNYADVRFILYYPIYIRYLLSLLKVTREV